MKRFYLYAFFALVQFNFCWSETRSTWSLTCPAFASLISFKQYGHNHWPESQLLYDGRKQRLQVFVYIRPSPIYCVKLIE
jgi:hypothetical protein